MVTAVKSARRVLLMVELRVWSKAAGWVNPCQSIRKWGLFFTLEFGNRVGEPFEETEPAGRTIM